ncbi:MAG: DUF4405 domain-containing protein [Desulfotalea sp.]
MKKITSLTLLIASIAMVFSSVVLYIVPSGRVAYWAQYKFLWLSKTQWGDIHIALGSFVVALVIFHFLLNIKIFLSYLRNRQKKISFFNSNLITALIIVAYVCVAALLRLPPMDYVLNYGEHITDIANEKYGEPPYGHAEMSSLSMFCKKMGLDKDEALAKLQSAGYMVTDTKSTIGQIALASNKTPNDVYIVIKSAVKKVFVPVKTTAVTPATATESVALDVAGQPVAQRYTMPDSPQSGFGKLTLEEACTTYGIDQEKTLAAIRGLGYRADISSTIKEVAEQNNTNPMAIFEILHEVASSGK